MSNDQTKSNDQTNELSPVKRALVALKDMQARVKQLEYEKSEPIAVIGMGCRFPGEAAHPDAFWQMLTAGVDASGEVPPDRWDAEAFFDEDPKAVGKMVTKRGGFLKDPAGFDPEFFNISPREAEGMDPQQRLLLEVSWEALEHAGIAQDRLMGGRTGVYVGLMGMDYGHLMSRRLNLRDYDPYTGSGANPSFPAGRLSFNLGFQGPSMVVATACSSSLVSTHLACQALRAKECHLALAGGVNLIFSPAVNVYLSRMTLLAPDGRSKIFDNGADGYGRGEGCGMLVLKRLSDAKKDGDIIYAQVRGSAVNHDGAGGGLTMPNGPAQEKLIQQALEAARVKPGDVGYVEVGATGTAMADPIEVTALNEVFGPGRDMEQPLYLGSVKTNMGHLEAAAGVAGLIKTILMLFHRKIPPHLHLRQPSEKIPWRQLPLRVNTETIDWPEGAPCLAGVSAIGLSGINAHVVLEGPPESTAPSPRQVGACLLLLSAKVTKALQQLSGRYQSYLAEHPHASLYDLCANAALGRVHHDKRLAVICHSAEELQTALAHFAEGKDHPSCKSGGGSNQIEGDAQALPYPDLGEGGADLSAKLTQLAQAYASGMSLELERLFTQPYGRLALPTYPFQNRRLWILPEEKAESEGPSLLNPLLIEQGHVARESLKQDGVFAMIPLAELGKDSSLAAKVWDLGRTYAMAPGCVSQVTGRAFVFLNEEATAYFFCNHRRQMLVAQVYTGPAEAYEGLVRGLRDYCRDRQLECNLIVEREDHRARLEQMGFSSTIMGVWQNIEDLSNYSLDGKKMRRLRYAVSRYQKIGEHQTVEYTLGDKPEVDQQIISTIDAWLAEKGQNAGPLTGFLKDAVRRGWPGSESRVFLVWREGVLEGVLMVIPLPGYDNHLMDVEYYRPDVPMGAMECGIMDIIEKLKEEGKTRFSLGLTPLTQLEHHPNEDPAVWSFFQSIHDEGSLNGDANFQFKNKFRPVNEPAWLCRPKELGVEQMTEFLMMFADPTNRSNPAVAPQEHAAGPVVEQSPLTAKELAEADAAEQGALLTNYLLTQLALVLHTDPNLIDRNQEINTLGVDSLMVMELRNQIQQDLKVDVPAVDFFEFPTLSILAEMVLKHFHDSYEAQEEAGEVEADEGMDLGIDVEGLSDEEVNAMLAQMMEEGESEA